MDQACRGLRSSTPAEAYTTGQELLYCFCSIGAGGLATRQPHDAEVYQEIGKLMAKHGYVSPGRERPFSQAAK